MLITEAVCHFKPAGSQQKPQYHGRHSPMDFLECLDRTESDTILRATLNSLPYPGYATDENIS